MGGACGAVKKVGMSHTSRGEGTYYATCLPAQIDSGHACMALWSPAPGLLQMHVCSPPTSFLTCNSNTNGLDRVTQNMDDGRSHPHVMVVVGAMTMTMTMAVAV